jgi:hypothetical protein
MELPHRMQTLWLRYAESVHAVAFSIVTLSEVRRFPKRCMVAGSYVNKTSTVRSLLEQENVRNEITFISPWLTPWSRVIAGELIVGPLVEELHVFYRIRCFITVFTQQSVTFIYPELDECNSSFAPFR